MPLHLLRRKNEIYDGNRSVLLELLHQIRKVSGHECDRAGPCRLG